MKRRIESLDALRGFAILTMVLSGSISFGDVLPHWMYHAQVPPPDHIFHPEIPGITWVDLVFPFFLFSMGAALPLSLNKKLHAEPIWKIYLQIIQRGILLCYFSLFTMHVRSYINNDPNAFKYLLAMGSFILIHCMFVKWPGTFNQKLGNALKIISFIISFFMLFSMKYKDGSGFSFTRIDIIIMVLANMAVFGSVIWILTRNQPWVRLLTLPVIMGIFLSGSVPESWQEAVYKWAPVKGLYSFYYLKYLFIIIPGTIAGEWLLQFSKRHEHIKATISKVRSESVIVAVLSWALLITNLIGLYARSLLVNVGISGLIIGMVLYFTKKMTRKTGDHFYDHFLKAGSYLLILGLVFEAYQGGIKKDISTYSYYFVTAGLAFYILASFLLLEGQGLLAGPIRFFANNGKNPMVAYVAGNLILIPLMHLTYTSRFMDAMDGNAWTGFLRGVIFTGIVSLITIGFVRLKFFWKT